MVLILPLMVVLVVPLMGNLNICNISSNNILELYRNKILYIVIGMLAYYLIVTVLWRLFLQIIFGGFINDTKTLAGQAAPSAEVAAQPAVPAAQPASVNPAPRTANIVLTCLAITVVLVGLGVFAVFQVGKTLLPKIDLGNLENLLPTPGTDLPLGSGPEDYQLWVGDMPNTYYRLNIIGERAMQITGKPWMVVKYNNITQEILDVEFGVSEVIVGANNPDWPAVAGPFDNSDWVYPSQLGLKPPIYTVVWFDEPVPGDVEGIYKSKTIVQGVQQISFVYDVSHNALGLNKEQWTFTYTGESMTGGVTNLDTYAYLGNDSDANAFHLRRIK